MIKLYILGGLFFLAALIIWGCQSFSTYFKSGYYQSRKEVSYRYIDYPAYKKVKVKLEDVDPKHFQTIAWEANTPTYYAKDHRHVYYRGAIIEGANPATFQIIDYNYHFSRDDQNVYCRTEIVSKDVANFRMVKPGWFADSKQVWYGTILRKDLTPEALD